MSSDTSSLKLAASTQNSDVGPLGDSSPPSDTQDDIASRQLSTFERLPLEIREMVYGYLGIVAMTNPEQQPTNALSSPDARFRWIDNTFSRLSEITVADALTPTNVGIRVEILDILFHLRVFEIKCWPTKSNKSWYRFIFWVNHGKG